MPRNRDEAARNLAREARKAPSVAETVMWKFLRNGRLGFKFRREHSIGTYRLDFYCHEALLCVETDGEQHDSAKDKVRDTLLSGHAILTYRIRNRDFFDLDEETALRNEIREIQRLCEERSGRKAFA